MSDMQYQGLFYLSTGVGGFLIVALFFRSLGLKSKLKKASAGGDTATDTLTVGAWNNTEALEVVQIVSETHDVTIFA